MQVAGVAERLRDTVHQHIRVQYPRRSCVPEALCAGRSTGLATFLPCFWVRVPHGASLRTDLQLVRRRLVRECAFGERLKSSCAFSCCHRVGRERRVGLNAGVKLRRVRRLVPSRRRRAMIPAGDSRKTPGRALTISEKPPLASTPFYAPRRRDVTTGFASPPSP